MHLPEKYFWQFLLYVFTQFGRLCENFLGVDMTALLTHCLTCQFLDLLSHIGQQKNNFKKNFQKKSSAFWIWFLTNNFQWNISSLGAFDPYVIMSQFGGKSNQVLKPLSFDSTRTFMVDKQPLWLSILCSVWK